MFLPLSHSSPADTQSRAARSIDTAFHIPDRLPPAEDWRKLVLTAVAVVVESWLSFLVSSHTDRGDPCGVYAVHVSGKSPELRFTASELSEQIIKEKNCCQDREYGVPQCCA